MYNVLLVDDEPGTLEALEKNVDWRCCGVRKIYKAPNSRRALELLGKEPIEILICDIEMPGGSGLQLLELLREQRKEVSCIFLTCHPEFDYMRKAIQLKCYDYILKPIRYEEFTRVLTELVHKMEAAESGEDMERAVNWKGVTDASIARRNQDVGERDVEKEVKKYIREHMVDNITVLDMAKELHFSPKYLMRAFKAKTSLSIGEYITLARMDTAKKVLLETELSVKEIAEMTGYADQAYFTRVFKKETGKSPSKWRSEARTFMET